MGTHHEQESNAPLIPMDPFPNRMSRDPPPYAYNPITPSSSSPTSPVISPLKTVLSPPPQELHSISESLRPLDPRDPLSTCDSRFANIITTKIILPRLRVGVLRWKDRESFEYVPQTKEDKKQRIHRSKYDQELGFIASEYKFRFHAIERIVVDELQNAGFNVKRIKIKEKDHRGISVKWCLKEAKNKRPRGQSGGCCCCTHNLES